MAPYSQSAKLFGAAYFPEDCCSSDHIGVTEYMVTYSALDRSILKRQGYFPIRHTNQIQPWLNAGTLVIDRSRDHVALCMVVLQN